MTYILSQTSGKIDCRNRKQIHISTRLHSNGIKTSIRQSTPSSAVCMLIHAVRIRRQYAETVHHPAALKKNTG